MITFTRLKYLSFAHSAVYLTLLVLAILNAPAKLYFGWAHGIGWIPFYCKDPAFCIWLDPF